MNERGSGIAAACALLKEAIALLDSVGEDAEAANISLSLERLAFKYDVMQPAGSTRDPG